MGSREIAGGFDWREGHQVVRVEAWGPDSVRVRVGLTGARDDVPGALEHRPAADVEVEVGADHAVPVNGELRVELGDGLLGFVRDDTREELPAEERIHFWWPGARRFTSTGNGYHRVVELVRVASETGLPPMRPLFVDHPDDEAAWPVDDQFLFGPDLLVAPVYRLGQRSREVRLPAGARWTDRATGVLHEGGQVLLADAPLDRIPLFAREGAQLP